MAEPHTVVPFSPLRKVIAARMTEATRTIPHFRLVVDIELDALLSLRERMNAANLDSKVSINDCIVKSCASALMEHPAVNVQLAADEIHQYQEANISIVVSVEGGLATPVIRSANRKSVWDISSEAKALTARAAARQLKMDEILGGSFSVSNLGMYGVEQFDAIINPPQCAILAVGCAKLKTIVSARREVQIATLLRATLSVDHRAIDGATGAMFLATLRQKLENPETIFSRNQ